MLLNLFLFVSLYINFKIVITFIRGVRLRNLNIFFLLKRLHLIRKIKDFIRRLELRSKIIRLFLPNITLRVYIIIETVKNFIIIVLTVLILG